MKKFIFAIIIATCSLSSFAHVFTEEVKVSYAVKQSFLKEFGDIKQVTWQNAQNNMVRGIFMMDEEKFSAFFNEDGILVATTIEKDLKDLPAKLKSAINKKLAGFDISESFELITNSDNAYYFKASKDGSSAVYKGYPSGTIHRTNIKH